MERVLHAYFKDLPVSITFMHAVAITNYDNPPTLCCCGPHFANPNHALSKLVVGHVIHTLPLKQQSWHLKLHQLKMANVRKVQQTVSFSVSLTKI